MSEPYSKPFIKIVDYLIDEIEGGHTNDPNDRGGETKYGISKAAYPRLDIRALNRDQAVAIYWRDYWLAAGCEELPPPLGMALFDGAVNLGIPRASKFIQEAVGVAPDGRVGQATIRAARDADVWEALVEYFSLRAAYYHSLAASSRSQAKFIKGWLRRTFKVAAWIARAYL